MKEFTLEGYIESIGPTSYVFGANTAGLVEVLFRETKTSARNTLVFIYPLEEVKELLHIIKIKISFFI